MKRRAVAKVVHILTAVIVSVAVLAGPAGPVAMATPDPVEPPTTENPFLPENRDLTDCLGTVERPGCGSKERGGWRQTLVFMLMGVGLVIVFGRVGFGVYNGRKQAPKP